MVRRIIGVIVSRATASAMVVGIEIRGSESGAWEPRDNLIVHPHKPWWTEPKMWG